MDLLINAPKLLKDPRWPTTQKEGWFGHSTQNLGVDKLAHAYSSYIISELLYGRIKRKVGDAPGIELTAAALASGIMLWSEVFDSIEGSWFQAIIGVQPDHPFATCSAESLVDSVTHA